MSQAVLLEPPPVRDGCPSDSQYVVHESVQRDVAVRTAYRTDQVVARSPQNRICQAIS